MFFDCVLELNKSNFALFFGFSIKNTFVLFRNESENYIANRKATANLRYISDKISILATGEMLCYDNQ